MNGIKNVIGIDRVQCSGLEGMSGVSPDIIVPHDIQWSEIPIQVPAKLSIINKVETGNSVWQTELTFRTCEKLDTRGHWAYRVKLANGEVRLIGGHQRPYPITTIKESMPDNMTDSQLLEVSVTLNSREQIPVIH